MKILKRDKDTDDEELSQQVHYQFRRRQRNPLITITNNFSVFSELMYSLRSHCIPTYPVRQMTLWNTLKPFQDFEC